MPGDFKDHFSDKSGNYAQYRPTYPDALYRYLAGKATRHDVAWDCATGNGQVATALARYFHNVIATDASQAQIDAAAPHPAVEYRVAKAEASGLESDSIDLITVAQAAHWFDQPEFMIEAARVLRPAGLLAIWCYELCNVNDECDAIIDLLYREIVGDFWPPERILIEQGYDGIDLPGSPVAAENFHMSLDWRVEDMLGYLGTWSACKRFEKANAEDPVEKIADDLKSAWGSVPRRVVWPLHIKASRADTLLQ